MKIYWEFPSAWWSGFVSIFIVYLILLISRKKRGSNELKAQLLVGLSSLIIGFIFEDRSVAAGLWNYNPGNWPAILWPIYFEVGLLAYQLVKKIEEILGK